MDWGTTIQELFWKYSIFPAIQSKDKRLISKVAQNNGQLHRNIKVETIAKKVVVGSAVQRHGFVFDYTKARSQTENESSSDEADSF